MMVCLILTHNVIRIYHKSCWRQLSYCGLHLRAVSEFGKKSDAVCGFLAYSCAVLRFSDPPYAPLLVAFFFSDWMKKPIDCFRVRQYVLTDSIDKYLFHHSIILLTDIFLFFQNTSVWRTKILVELISIMLLNTHSKSDSHPNQKTWYSLHF